MATFTAGTSFTDGVTGDVTAAKLNALVANATPLSNLITDRTAETSVASGDLVLIADASDSNALKKMTVTNLFKTDVSITSGTGTAGTVAIGPTGDTNTGLFFPAADTIAFSEGGTEAMRIDSNGNVGIGRSPNYQLDVYRSGSGSPAIAAANDTIVTAIQSSGTTQGNVGTISSHPLALMTNNTERLRIDSSGNVGIGTTSPAFRIHSYDASGSSILGCFENNQTEAYISFKASGTTANSTVRLGATGNNLITFVNGTERLRITSGGEVYIAGTTDQGAYNLQVNGTGVWGAGAYVNGSDSRIKEDIQPLASGLDVVEKLNPVTYKYKETWSSDQSIQSGFIAQELLTALDGQIYVNGVVQQGGAEGYYSVAYQNLIAVLTKAIQELKAENDSLKSRVAALEAA